MKEPSVEVSILVYNQWASTLRLLKSIQKNTHYYNRKITIVDNASTDETPQKLKLFYLNEVVQSVIRNNENIGFPKGHNQIIKASNADYICLLNNDVEVPENWLRDLINEAEEDEEIGMIAPINRTQGRLIIGGKLFKDGTGKHLHEEDRGKEEIDWLQFSCVLIKRDVIKFIGNLDEDFSPGYYEDVDACLRAKEAGFRLICSPNVIIEHYDGVTSKSAGLKKYQEINRIKFIQKWKDWLDSNK